MKRLLSMLLALVLALGLLPAGAFAASSEEEALGEINIFNGGYRMNYLAMNGQVQSQNYVYYLFDTGSGTKEIPAYCVTPNQPGVQKVVEEGESIRYLAEEKSSDPKVVGIVASRLSEKYSRPSFMIHLNGSTGKGSCRSWGGFNLFAALENCKDLLLGFGGHELAAGFTIREENIPAFAAAMNDYVCACTGGEEMVSALDIDGELDDVGLLTLEGVEGLELLEPYGAGNPKPVFSLSGCLVSAVNEVGGGRHLKLKLTASGRSFDAIFFSATAEEAGVGPGDRVDVAFTPQINEYRGWRSVQLQLCDLRPALTRAQAERALYEKFRRGEHP